VAVAVDAVVVAADTAVAVAVVAAVDAAAGVIEQMEYREQGVRISPSPHGWGVFSLRSFAVRQIIGQVQGTVIDDAEYESDYCIEVGDHSVLEPVAPFRYLNHSCHPNCALIKTRAQGEDGVGPSEVWVQVERGVVPGEQLTIDYAWPADVATPCSCGCPECRKWIVAAEELGQIGAKDTIVSNDD
jgi:uncharacterized protein